MKKIIYFVFTLSIFACSKNDFIPAANDTVAESKTKSTVIVQKVSSENGYLVVKDFQTLDSLISEVKEMTDLERLAWENKMNFESAYTHFSPYFNIISGAIKVGPLKRI